VEVELRDIARIAKIAKIAEIERNSYRGFPRMNADTPKIKKPVHRVFQSAAIRVDPR